MQPHRPAPSYSDRAICLDRLSDSELKAAAGLYRRLAGKVDGGVAQVARAHEQEILRRAGAGKTVQAPVERPVLAARPWWKIW